MNNFLDLQEGPGILDWACGGQTYDGHTGQDSDLRSFREMDIGVPVFAALDGQVLSVEDGNYDRNYGSGTAPFDNHVVLDHGGGRFTIYGHLRKGITLRRGQTVRAGQQLGWTASSGNSTWPHLHFTLIEDGAPQEPFAGPCREGESGWAEQAPIPTEPYVRDLVFSERPLTGKADVPHDLAARTGTFVRGVRYVRFRLELGAAFDASVLGVKIVRPDGSIAVDHSRPIPFPVYHGRGGGRFWYRLQLGPLGTWRLEVTLDGRTVAVAPFSVVVSRARVRNRAPNPIAALVRAVGAAFRCEISTSLVTEDPDYAIIRYRYRWTVGGTKRREVTSAALSDLLRGGLASAGEQVSCSVTPSDGKLSGPTATASMVAPRLVG